MLPAKAILESALVDVAADVPGFVELVLNTVKLISPILVPRNRETSSRFCASELKSKIYLYLYLKKKFFVYPIYSCWYHKYRFDRCYYIL